ncbi:MAG: sugar phosphate isomerase/epimerase family protein [Bryobacteraceae bacterium]
MRISRRDLAAIFAGGAVTRAQTRIRVGCQTRAYGSPIRDRAQLLSVLEDLAAAGYEGFETNFASLESSFEDPAPVRAEIEKRRIKLIGLHGTVNFTNPAHLQKDRAQLDRLAAACKGLGAELLILSSNGVPRDSGGGLQQAALKLRCEELNRAGAACRALGVRLATHNHAKEVENNGEEVEAVLERTEARNLSMLMDAAYVHGAGLDVPAFFRKHRRRIAGVHVRDQRDGKEVDLGKGNLDLKGIGEALRDTGWSGWVILEINRRAGVSSRELVEYSRKFMREVMKI